MPATLVDRADDLIQVNARGLKCLGLLLTQRIGPSMSELDTEESRVAEWHKPLAGDTGPCGPDLEYDNDFLAITLAAAGKPESQFGPAEPPDWRGVADRAGVLFERTRDLRIAILWLRAGLHLWGYGVLPVGLRLINGLIETQWDHLHPLPDPDDGDPYARVNALSVLRESEGLIGDLRVACIIEDRAIGEFRTRTIELALGLSAARAGDTVASKEQVLRMMAAAVDKVPALRMQCEEALTQVRRLMSQVNDKLGSHEPPDLRPLYSLINGVTGMLPPVDSSQESAMAEEACENPGPGKAQMAAQSGLSGTVRSREEAIRAIDMICEYLERTEPANPAPLFLRRARQLINHNFLQLMKVLAPEALAGVAGLVGIDPDDIQEPDVS